MNKWTRCVDKFPPYGEWVIVDQITYGPYVAKRGWTLRHGKCWITQSGLKDFLLPFDRWRPVDTQTKESK